MRVKRGCKARHRRKKIFKLAKGFRGRSKNTIRQTTQRVEKALCYAYRDRKARKRDFRRLWITRINAALSDCGINYASFISGLKKAGVGLDRKMLADLGAREPKTFMAVVDLVRKQACV
ncbi:MAG: 50S ribosomal protein L20 [Deltaproteobacteria bacterium]|nr:50S ribosomal protein L20 [Deltaproteobacteria bacterium]